MLRRRKKKKSGIRDADQPIDCSGHRQHVRGFECALEGKTDRDCFGKLHAHHSRSKGAGGGDDTCVPLCATHHDYVHTRGQEAVERDTGVRFKKLAEQLWRQSPQAIKWRFEHD